jgi:hypothetical protein
MGTTQGNMNMNATNKKDGDFSLVKLGKIAAAVEIECGDLIGRMKLEIAGREAAKADKAASGEAVKASDSTLWADFVLLARTVDAFTVEAANDKLTEAVFTALVTEVAEGEAAKSISAYSSTARKTIGLVRSGKASWSMVEEMAYSEVRDAMKSEDAKLVAEARDTLNKVIRRIAKHKNKKHAAATLLEIAELLESYAVDADASRENDKHAAKMAKGLQDVRQQAPTAPATLETVAA